MSRIPAEPFPPKATLSLKIGKWFEANATGWGVICVPLVILLLAGVALLSGLLT